MMNKKLLSMLLCGIMLVGIIAGCVDGDSDEIDTDFTVEEDTGWVSVELPYKEDYVGKEVHILCNNAVDMGPDEKSSDPLEDAVYRRNDKIESQYGVILNNLVETDYLELGEKVKTDVTAGTGDYHIVYQQMVNTATNLAMGNCLYNLTDLNYVDFDQPWWDQDCKNGFMFGDKMMMVCGDLMPSSMLVTAAIIFNKNLFDDQGIAYPYEDARQGTWTIDDMLEITEDQTRDLNGDGKIVCTDDFCGLTGWALESDYNFYFGSGCTMFRYDENHLPVYDADTDRLQTIYDKIYQLIITQESFHPVYEDVERLSVNADPNYVFKQGRALFFSAYLSTCTFIRDMKDDYGIVPQPKYDENQEEYLSFVNGAASVACVPKSLNDADLELSGYMLEMLSSSSYYMVTDTLYDKIAKSKTARDPESAEMVDVIIRHRVFDFGYTHFHEQRLPCASIVLTALLSNSPSIVKEISKSQKATKKALREVYEAYGYEYNQ